MTFIGPKPENTPKFVLPFRAYGDQVKDQNNVIVAQPDLESTTDDREMARAIAEALNDKFGAKPEPAPKLRTLIGWRLRTDEDEFVEDSRAYEISPGRFEWASSREAAETWVGTAGGWRMPNAHYRFVDVETGQEVK